MVPSTYRPTRITLDRENNVLEISWNDGVTFQYPLDQLREACPCVECRGGHQYMGAKFAPDNILELKPARSYKMTDLKAVGNYALQPFWDDGHTTGIYSWDYLRHIHPGPSDDEATSD